MWGTTSRKRATGLYNTSLGGIEELDMYPYPEVSWALLIVKQHKHLSFVSSVTASGQGSSKAKPPCSTRALYRGRGTSRSCHELQHTHVENRQRLFAVALGIENCRTLAGMYSFSCLGFPCDGVSERWNTVECEGVLDLL